MRTCMHANESRAATTLYIDRLTPVDHEHRPGGGQWKSTYVGVAGDLYDVLLKRVIVLYGVYFCTVFFLVIWRMKRRGAWHDKGTRAICMHG